MLSPIAVKQPLKGQVLVNIWPMDTLVIDLHIVQLVQRGIFKSPVTDNRESMFPHETLIAPFDTVFEGNFVQWKLPTAAELQSALDGIVVHLTKLFRLYNKSDRIAPVT